jgi:hypothetical protein
VELPEREWLRIVHDDEVILLVEESRVLLRVGQVALLIRGAQPFGRTLEPVVDRLGHSEEGVVAADQLPVGCQSEVAQQRDLRA